MTHTEVLAIYFGVTLVFLWGFVLGIFVADLLRD